MGYLFFRGTSISQFPGLWNGWGNHLPNTPDSGYDCSKVTYIQDKRRAGVQEE